MKYTIFSIDEVNNLHKLAKFTRHIDTQVAMGNLSGSVVTCIGSYKGEIEQSFMMLTADYETHVKPHGFTDKQESVLLVSECNKQYADLLFSNGSRLSIGSLKCVTKEEAMKQEAWTYRPDINQYWVAVDGNPDTVRQG